VVKAIGCQPRVPLSILGIITFFMLKLILNVKKSAASPRVSCSVHTHPPGGRTFRLIQIWEKRRRLTENFNVECGNHTLCLCYLPRLGLGPDQRCPDQPAVRKKK
jgi:hypothetical protein